LKVFVTINNIIYLKITLFLKYFQVQVILAVPIANEMAITLCTLVSYLINYI